MRFEFLPVGTGVLDGPETIRFSLRIGVSMRFDFLPVGVDVPDDPETMVFLLRIGVLMRFEFFACRDRRPRRSEKRKDF